MARRDEAGFEAFVAARSDDLLRTAVLLTRDRGGGPRFATMRR